MAGTTFEASVNQWAHGAIGRRFTVRRGHVLISGTIVEAEGRTRLTASGATQIGQARIRLRDLAGIDRGWFTVERLPRR